MRRSVLVFFLCLAPVVHAQPPEYQWGERWKSPEMLAGIGLLVGGYAGTVLYGTQTDKGFGGELYIPLVGPWIQLFDEPDCGVDLDCAYDNEDRAALVGLGVAQAVGAGLMTYALVRHREPKNVAIAPSFSGGAAGFKVVGKF